MLTLPKLDYNYSALEPHIDAKTMEIHHQKHHQGYVDKANAALEKHPQWHAKPAEEILKQLQKVPEDIQTAVRNNLGGVVNHSFFWRCLHPNGGTIPSGSLKDDLKKTFGSIESFKEVFEKAAASRFGSGWAWLVINPQGELEVISTPNQDSPLSMGDYRPLLGLDVWEHAYYLNYQNRRPDYIKAFWNIVHWDFVASEYDLK